MQFFFSRTERAWIFFLPFGFSRVGSPLVFLVLADNTAPLFSGFLHATATPVCVYSYQIYYPIGFDHRRPTELADIRAREYRDNID